MTLAQYCMYTIHVVSPKLKANLTYFFVIPCQIILQLNWIPLDYMSRSWIQIETLGLYKLRSSSNQRI